MDTFERATCARVGDMRILALHPSGSSADDLQRSLRDLGDGLQAKHDIELVHVDAPLLSSPASSREERRCGEGLDEQPDENHPSQKRCWFDAALNGTKSCDARDARGINFVGLDASILHLSQIWNRRVHSNPFSGIVAFGQSAAIAALLPLLVRPVLAEEMEGTGDDYEQQTKDDEKEGVNLGVPLFPGLDFVVLVDGFDITTKHEDPTTASDMPWFDPSAPESLHIISQGSNVREAMSKKLASRYGESAQIHCRTTTHNANSSEDEDPMRCFYDEGVVLPLRKRELNVIGRFVVSQKNALTRRTAAHANADDSSNAEQLAKRMQTTFAIQETRQRLGMLEEEAERALVQHVSVNPPRALMAVIAPDVVGAWSGPKWRRPNMDGGGAPCPAEFRQKEGERGDGDDEQAKTAEGGNTPKSKIIFEREEGEARKAFAEMGIGRQHPSATS